LLSPSLAVCTHTEGSILAIFPEILGHAVPETDIMSYSPGSFKIVVEICGMHIILLTTSLTVAECQWVRVSASGSDYERMSGSWSEVSEPVPKE